MEVFFRDVDQCEHFTTLSVPNVIYARIGLTMPRKGNVTNASTWDLERKRSIFVFFKDDVRVDKVD